jgi:NTP pyrophosphatase (non-canonical NTP hydrolase)
MDLARLSDDVEVVSRGYAHAHGFTRDRTWFLLKLQEEVGELTQAFLMRTGQARSKGNTQQELDDRFGAELADVLCHVVLMARHHGVDLEEHVERKWLVWHPDRSASAVGGSEPTAKTVGLLSGLRNIGTVDGAKQ